MNVTFLVGNGFDIACGVDTSYRAFYEWYKKQTSSSQHIANLKENIQQYGDDWADFEIGFGKYARNFSADTIKNFYECYEDAHKSMIRFLNEQISKIDADSIDKDNLIKFKNGIVEFYKELPSKEANEIKQIIRNNNEMYFISFNYTDLLNKVIVSISKLLSDETKYIQGERKWISPDVINVHGTLTYHPILGVSEAYQVENKELINNLTFADIMIKSRSVEKIGEIWYDNATDIINFSNIICIFGMSLGASDSEWWGKIMDWLVNDENNHLIIFWYSKNPPNNISILETINKKDEVKEKICQYSSLTAEGIQEIKKRIHVVFNSKNVLNLIFPKKDKSNKNELITV